MSVMHRRQFIEASGTALGGLFMGVYLPRLNSVLTTQDATQLTAFIRIEPGNAIVIGARSCEIGQGVRTSLPMLVAEELDVPWSMVRVEQLPYGLDPGPTPAGVRPRYGPQGAGGSTSIPDGWGDLRRAGAQAR